MRPLGKRQPPRREERNSGEARSAGNLIFEPLDKDSFIPMYFQIQSQLLKMIRSRQLPAGEMLPGEEELSRIYGVSRMTSRQALQGLKNQGYAYRQKGRGTFVNQPRVEKDIAHLQGFSAEMRGLGLRPSSRILKLEIASPPPEIAVRLNMDAGSHGFHLHRVRSAEGIPVAIEEVWLPYAQFPGIEKNNFVRHSLYETLREKYGVRIGAADEVIEAQPAGKHEADLLEIPLRSSLLVISRTLLTANESPVEAGLSLYRGDRYRAVLRVPASNSE
jgi:GntR family transcriptional regulator